MLHTMYQFVLKIRGVGGGSGKGGAHTFPGPHPWKNCFVIMYLHKYSEGLIATQITTTQIVTNQKAKLPISKLNKSRRPPPPPPPHKLIQSTPYPWPQHLCIGIKIKTHDVCLNKSRRSRAIHNFRSIRSVSESFMMRRSRSLMQMFLILQKANYFDNRICDQGYRVDWTMKL